MLDQAFAHCPIFPTAASRRSLGRVSVPVWLIILSDQLLIVALVSRYLTNKLIRRGTIQGWPKPFSLRTYAVLATVSSSYSPPLGRFPRVTHPFATKVTGASPGPSFDLHVLGMPPAFVLSQDQTLKLNSPSPEGRRKVRELSFAQIFGLTKRCTNIDRSCRAESTQRPPPAHPFYFYLQCQRARKETHLRQTSHRL